MRSSPLLAVPFVAPVLRVSPPAAGTPWQVGDWVQLRTDDQGQWSLLPADAAALSAAPPESLLPSGDPLPESEWHTLPLQQPVLARVWATEPQLALQIVAARPSTDAVVEAMVHGVAPQAAPDAPQTTHAMQPDWALWQRRDMGSVWVQSALVRSEAWRAPGARAPAGPARVGLPAPESAIATVSPTEAELAPGEWHIPFTTSAGARDWLDESWPLLQQDEPVVGLSGHPVWMSALPLAHWLKGASAPGAEWGRSLGSGGAFAVPSPCLSVLTVWNDQPLAWELSGPRHALGLTVAATSASALAGIQRHWPHWALALARSGWRLGALQWTMASLSAPRGHQTRDLDAALLQAAAELLAAL